MGNITDYVIGYGRYTIDEEPFNEVDSLVLSQFSYLKFDKILTGSGRVKKAMRIWELKESGDYETLYADSRFEKVNRELFEAMAGSRRFSSVRLYDHVNIVDPQWEIQFSAITCMFDNGFTYVAFRGTDETLTGWKEDFNMSFITPVPAQEKAVQYLNRIGSSVASDLTVGGHSKGGNLAVYASMMCRPKVRSRIEAIYSHDGPGFAEGVLDSEEFACIKDRIRKSVPRSSVVGMVLQTQENYEVVKCRNFGLLQHDPYNWLIDGVGFKKADSIFRHRYVTDRSVNKWIRGMDREQRQEFVGLLFEIVRGLGSDDLNDVMGDPVNSGRRIKSTYEGMNEEDRDILKGIFRDLSDAIGETVREYVSEQIEEEKEKYRKKLEEGSDKLSGYIDKLIGFLEEEHK